MKINNFTQNCIMLLLSLILSGITVIGATPENIALNKITYATGNVYETYEPSKMVDGDDSDDSVWSTDSDFPHSIVVDLGSEYAIDSTELVVFRGRTPKYTISVADNDSNFVQVIDRTNNTTPGLIEAPIKDQFDAVVARYIKIEVTGFVEETGNYFALSEFRVFGVEYIDLTPENIALNKPTSTTSTVYETYESSKIVDGDDSDNSVWSSDAIFPQSLVVDFGGEYVIDSTELVCFRGNVHLYTISVSDDNSTFTQVIDRTANATPGTVTEPVKDKFNGVVARYVKITLTGIAIPGDYFGLTEFRVFGIEYIPTSNASKTLSDAGIYIYPNPCSTRLTIAGGKGEAGIEVYSLQGTKAYQTSRDVSFPHQVDVSSCKSGIYLVKVIKDGKHFTQKVVKK